jgi:PAS domain S-box-containing protein
MIDPNSAPGTQEMENSFQVLAESLPQLVWIARHDGALIYANQRTIDYTGLPFSELSAWGWLSIVKEEDSERYRQEWRRSLHTGMQYQIEYRLREAATGEYRWFLGRAIPLYDNSGKITRWFGTCTDIDDQKQVQEALRLSEQRFRALSASSPIGIFTTDVNGQLTYANPRCQAIAGFSYEEAEGAGWSRWIFEEDAEWVLTRWFLALEERHEFNEEFRWSTPRGIRWAVLQASPMRNEHGEMLGYVGTLRDTTSERSIAEDLKLARDEAEAASRAKDYFLATLSHELRTPLTPILAQSQLILTDASLPQEFRDQADVIRRNAELEVLLIDDLLDLTRIRNGKLRIQPVVTDMNRLIRQALETAREDAFIRSQNFEVTLSASQTAVFGDPARLQQVFWNLIKNSVKFSPNGATIRIDTTNVDDSIEVSIADDGVGIDPDEIERIFQPFEQILRAQTKEPSSSVPSTASSRFPSGASSRSPVVSGGLGLGLPIATSIVHLHNGSLSASSDGHGKGATFTVRLPIHTSDNVTPATNSDPQFKRNRKYHLLLVDDHGDTGRVFQLLLQRQGYDVTVATDVRSAIAAADRQDFDLIISDIGLPDGSGLELMQTLRFTKKIRGIAMSGFGMDDDVARSKEAGFSEHLTKPVSFLKLKQTVEELLAN